MLTLKVNELTEFTLKKDNSSLLLNGEEMNMDWIKIGADKYHAIINDQSLTIELTDKDEKGKILSIVINGITYRVNVENELDQLLKKLGMDKMASDKVNSVKAPMPGLVLRIHVKPGDAVKKGDALLVLEAMKMENVIKSPSDAVIKKITVSERTAVDKNQMLIEFE
ncbi:MAG: biotin/lipoyl-binding protein [Bacteroidia bacterium]|jgi:biotin carboxyl carrier protein|nr:biotin/lipoyl-binding protein [Bacteroidia bacterium]